MDRTVRPGDPLVSLLIPTFDRPHFLQESLKSVLDQDHARLEVLVHDDGVDGAYVVEELDDPRVTYRANPNPAGMVANWAGLLDAASGDLVGLLMDDDRLLPSYVSRCVAAFEHSPDVGVVFTNHTFVSAGDEHPRPTLLAAGRYDDFTATFLERLPVAISGAMFRRQLWPAVRPLPDTGASDQVLFARLAASGTPFEYIDEALMRYRTHEGMFSATLDFRDDGVRAWDALSFPDDPSAEALRERRLAEALVSRAAAAVQRGQSASAIQDVRRALTLEGVPRAKALSLLVAARLPRIARTTAHARRLARGQRRG